jgi:ribose transport system permease protein
MARGKRSPLARLVARPAFSRLAILAVMFTLTAVLQQNFFETKAIVRNINAFMPLILMTMGQAVVIISGGLDLSAGTGLSLLTCVLTTVMKKDVPVTGFYALAAALAVALAIGVINGVGIGYLRIPPVIITFATSYLWLGIGLFLRPIPGGESVEWFRAFYNVGLVPGVPLWLKSAGAVVPPALVLILIGSALWLVVARTRTGRYLYAVGGNNESAYVSGIDTAAVQMRACLINSVFIFLTALYFVGQNQSGDARMGDPLTLRAIASAVVGGIALSGGRGGVFSALVGALIISFVSKIIFFANIPNAFQPLFGGLIVILALAGSQLFALSGKRSAEAGRLP